MKNLKWYVSISLMLTFCATVVKGFTSVGINIDGTADAQYGASALSTQTLATAARGVTTVGLDNNMGLIDQADGSELDAAYGIVSNGTLFLVLAGNLDSGGTGNVDAVAFDKLQVFFMTGPGGDHTLGTNYNGAADFGHINRMGVNGGGVNANPGLTFDTGFAPNYWIGATVGDVGTNPTFYVNYEVICSNCFGEFLGSSGPSNTMTGGLGVQAALNNINTNGVPGDPLGCPTNTAQASVRTGVELSIPLPTIGFPTGKVTVCAFITDDQYQIMYNQVLGPVVTNDCTALFSLDGDPSGIDFSTLPGKHTFTIPVPPCEAFLLNPTTASYTTNGGTGSVALTMVGNCPWQATSTVSWVTITSATSGSGNATISYSVATNHTVDPRTGTLTVTGGDNATADLTISEDGLVLPPLSTIIVDGTAESAYGCPLAVQQIQTQYGNSLGTNLMSNAGGSELDEAYGLIKDNILFLVFAGNLENNFNKINIFFMTGPGGQNTLTNVNPGVDSGGLNAMGATTNGNGAGLTFHTGFAPNYWISVTGGGAPYKLFANYAQLWPGGTNSSGVATNGYFLGSTNPANPTNGTLSAGTNPFVIQATLNDSNTNGVDGGTCATNASGQVESALASTNVTTGVELGIPLAAFGSPTGAIAICAFISSGSYTQMSNQVLPPLGTNDLGYCQGNLQGVARTSAIDLNTFPGQAYFLVGPEMHITGVTVVGKTNVNVSYQTANNANMFYQLQRTLGQLQTNSVWNNVPGVGSVLGNGAVVTQTDPFGGTNKSGVFYRVRQTPSGTPGFPCQ